MDAPALFRKLRAASNPAARLAVAEAIKSTVMDGNGNPTLAGTGISSHPEMVRELGKAVSPLLEAALQGSDWRNPSTMQDVEICSILLQAVSLHLVCCESAKLSFSLGAKLFNCMSVSGLLTSLPKALTQAHIVLVAPDSPAPTDLSCTQYISMLLVVFSSLLRNTPNSCMHLEDGDPLAPLLQPAAWLAKDVRRIYAGPDGARIPANMNYMPGYEVRLLARYPTAGRNMTPAMIQEAMQQLNQQAAKIACRMLIANALRVADTFSILAFNDCNFASWGHCPGEAQMRPLWRNRCWATMLCQSWLQPCCLCWSSSSTPSRGGKAGAAAPRTRSSGRTKQGPSSSSASSPLVPANHNQLASALGLDLLAADEELFLDVTRRGPPPASGPLKPDLTVHDIDSTLIDPLRGLLAILLHVQENNSPMTVAMQSTMLAAVLLAAVEVCALAPTEHGENALRVSTLTGIQLFGSFIRFAGPFAAGWVKEDADWVDPSSNPLDSPELQELVTPVMRDLVTLLVPLLLPDCHGIPLPGSGSADPMGSKLSALLPQVVFLMAAAAGKDVLAELLQEHPLWTTRTLEAALRVDWAERFETSPLVRCLLLCAVPAVLTSLGQPSDVTTSAMAAAGPSKLARLIASSSQRLRLQVHALLTTVVKCAAGLNARALRNAAAAAAAAAAPAPAASSSGSSSSNRVERAPVTDAERAPVADAQRAAVLARLGALLTPALKAQGADTLRQMNAGPAPPGFERFTQMVANMQQNQVSQMIENLQTAPTSSTSAAAADRVGQFRGSLELISSAAAAAAALSRAVSQAAATGTAAGSSTVPLTAPFVSLIGRCLNLTGTALEGASKEPKVDAAEFSGVSTALETLLSCLYWVVADTAGCQELLASTGAADAAAMNSLCTSLQQQLAQLQGPRGVGLQGQAVADMLRDSGLAAQLAAVGAAMCGVVTGVCGNPACSSLSELSEIALVTSGGGKKGRGKCSACAAVSYCSRGCQVMHWRQAHKAFCNAHKEANSTAG